MLSNCDGRETLMLKLKLPSFGHQMQRANSLKRPWCWERLRAAGEGGGRRWDGWMASPALWDMDLSKLWEIVEDRGACRGIVCGVANRHEWMTSNNCHLCFLSLFWTENDLLNGKVKFVTVLVANMFLKCDEPQPLGGNKGWEEKWRELREAVVKLYSPPLFSGASPNHACTHSVPSSEGRHVCQKPTSEWMMPCISGPALLLVLPSLL